MTKEKAIEVLEYARNYDGMDYGAPSIALDMAISALRQQNITDKDTDRNEPLTLNELWQIYEANEPVYLYIFGSDFDSGWQIIEQITDTKIIFRGKTNTYVPIKELGISYNLYRQKPEEGTV